MLLIPCPRCGPRAEIEFQWGGPAHLQRPDPTTATDRVWGEYLYSRTNPKGIAAERWRHAFGCRQWFNLLRDTATHEVLAVYAMGEPPPGAAPDPRPSPSP